jgi:hypothetical protein
MGMEKYLTGFRTGKAGVETERELPRIDIAGTMFLADIEKLEFREVANPLNRMSMLDAKEEMGFSHFFFDTRTKNLFTGATDIPSGIPGHVRIILLPPLKEIDPVGLARRYGLPEETNSTSRPLSRLTAFSKEKDDVPVKRKSQRV